LIPHTTQPAALCGVRNATSAVPFTGWYVQYRLAPSTGREVLQNPQFVAMAGRLGSALMQDPAMATMLGGLTDPAHKEKLESRIPRMNEDPTLKPILDEIDTGGPAAMMK
jgi:hypothetical protein